MSKRAIFSAVVVVLSLVFIINAAGNLYNAHPYPVYACSSLTYNTKNIFKNVYSPSSNSSSASINKVIPSTILLLDSKQLLSSAGDQQGFDMQAMFCNLKFDTTLNPDKKIWAVKAEVQNIAGIDITMHKVLGNATFYDINGDEIGQITDIPVADTLHEGQRAEYIFTIFGDNDLNGKIPTFVVMNYSFEL